MLALSDFIFYVYNGKIAVFVHQIVTLKSFCCNLEKGTLHIEKHLNYEVFIYCSR